MIVNWTGTHVNGTSVVEKMATGNMMSTKTIVLVPGYNEIPDDIWNKVSATFSDIIQSGKLLVIGAKANKDTKSIENEDGTTEVVETMTEVGTPLRRLRPDQAREAVLHCFNFNTLELWLKGNANYEAETRDEIRALIKDQLEKIMSGNEPRAAGIAVK